MDTHENARLAPKGREELPMSESGAQEPTWGV